MNDIQNKEIVNQIELVVKDAQSYVVSTVNTVLLQSYLKIGEIIYNSKNVSLRELEKELKPKYGDGFSRWNLSKMLIFYKDYGSGGPLAPHSEKDDLKLYGGTLSPHLSWLHYFFAIRHRPTDIGRSE